MGKRTTPRLQIVLDFIEKPITDFIQWAKSASAAISSDPDMSAPVVPLNQVNNHIANLENTVQTRVTNQSETLTDRQAIQANISYNDFTYLSGQAEMVANQKIAAAGGDFNAGLQFVRSLSFTAKNVGKRNSQIFEVLEVQGQGKCIVTCPIASKRFDVIYLWRFSTDPTNWPSQNMYMTTISKINFQLMQADTRYYFSYAIMGNTGKSNFANSMKGVFESVDWSDPVSAMIL